MKLDIVTPEGVLFSGEVDSVLAPGVFGEFEILNNHAPIVSILQKGLLRIKGAEIKIEDEQKDKFDFSDGEAHLPINSGTIEMKNNKVIILAE